MKEAGNRQSSESNTKSLYLLFTACSNKICWAYSNRVTNGF